MNGRIANTFDTQVVLINRSPERYAGSLRRHYFNRKYPVKSNTYLPRVLKEK